MPRVTFVDTAGREREVEVPVGTTLMQAAIDQGVAGIIGECGGSCSCGTCHVYVREDWLARLKPPESFEAALLEAVVEPRPNSRLSCQISMTPDLNGLRVIVVKSDY
jgi:2Fe-2S ferredoxin